MKRNRDVLLFGLLALVWGSSFMAIKAGLSVLPPVLFAALRYDVAGAVLFGYALVAKDEWRPRGLDQWLLVTVGGVLLIGVHFALLFVGQQYVTSATAAIILSTMPVLTPLFARVLLGQRLGVTGGLGVALGFLGVVVIAVPSGALGGAAVGVVLLFLSAVSFAFGSVVVTRLPASMPVVPMQAWMMLLGAGVLHGLSTLLGEAGPTAVTWSSSTLVALAYLSVVAGAGGFLVYFSLLDRLGPVEISLVNYAVPAVAALVGWVVLGETLTATTLVGFAVIVVGFALLKWEALAPAVARIETRFGYGDLLERFPSAADARTLRSDGGDTPATVDGDRLPETGSMDCPPCDDD